MPLVPVLGLLACHAAVVPPLPVALIVDSNAYHHRGAAPVPVSFTVTNPGRTPVLLAQCDGSPAPLIDRLSWGNWRYFEGGFCNGGQTSMLSLAPGDSLHGLVTVYSGGHYRLRMAGLSAPTEFQQRVASSPAFDVW
jgi:hypothetical protein